MRVLLTRPRGDSERLAQTLRARGYEVVIEPMLHIIHMGSLPPLDDIAGLIVTSSNGLRAFAAASDRRDLTVYAVGDATAGVARNAGFGSVETATGDAAALEALIAARVPRDIGTLLHVHGRDVTGNLDQTLTSRGYAVRSAVLYKAETATALSAATRDQLAGDNIDGAVFFSPRTARTFVRLIQDAGLGGSCKSIIALCLSDAVAKAVSALHWGAVHVAATPDTAAMLQICDAMREKRQT